MKTISQISKICGTTWEIVYRSIQRLNIIPVHKKGRINYYDDFQLELIIDNLFYAGKIKYLIYESKMNIPEVEESFEEFKKRTYTR